MRGEIETGEQMAVSFRRESPIPNQKVRILAFAAALILSEMHLPWLGKPLGWMPNAQQKLEFGFAQTRFSIEGEIIFAAKSGGRHGGQDKQPG